MKCITNLGLWSMVLAGFLSCKGKEGGRQNDASETADAPLRVKVAGYNVEYGALGSTKEIGEMLKPYDFDIVCFAEAPGGDWSAEVGQVMGLDHVVVGKYSTAGHEDKYKTIVSRTPLYGYEEVLMADTLHTATRAKTKIGGREFSVYAVHFPFGWRDQAHIDETTNKVATFVKYLKGHQDTETAILAGDFNFRPANADSLNLYHKMFMDIGLDLAWKEVGVDPDTRSTYIEKDKDVPGEVIDHIFYDPKRMKAMEGDIIELDPPLSDHKPVWALLEMRE